MSAIDNKYADLKANGIDLGSPLGPEEGASAGGRVRRYAEGSIYWASSTGARMIRGGILQLYLANGGPGINPSTGERDLGYPTSDEELVHGTSVPHSKFEWGFIYWTPGTGGVVIHGTWAMERFAALGLPITGNVPVAGGQAIYFQHGVVFSAGGVPGVDQLLIGTFSFPLLGRPLMLDPADPQFTFARWPEHDRSYYEALRAWRPTVFEELLSDRFALVEVTRPTYIVSLNGSNVDVTGTQFRAMVRAGLRVAAAGSGVQLADRKLYDLSLRLENGNMYPLSQHAVYTKADWERFGLLHITDLHVSGRNEGYRGRLQALGLDDAAIFYTNFQDNLKDFVRYANKLHDLRLADAVVATGDLIDYVEEDPDGEDNFARLRRLLLGEPLEPGGELGPELELPIFLVRGNHDYRLHPYDLRFDVKPNVPFLSGYDKGVNWFDAHNLIESEALALQGGHTPTYTAWNAEDAARQLRIDEFDNAYGTFKSMAPDHSYVVELGKHRLVVLDSKFDSGIPPVMNVLNFFQLVGGKHLGVFENVDYHPAAHKTVVEARGPDSIGLEPDELNLLRKAVADTGDEGVVIAAIHCPPFHQKGREYPYYQRETLHESAADYLTTQYLDWTQVKDRSTWPLSGTPHYKVGNLLAGFDDGFLAGGSQELIDVCVGKGGLRPVDLVLYGHHHARTEHRLRLNAAGDVEYLTDFYTENPERYYATSVFDEVPGQPFFPRVMVRISSSASPAPVPTSTPYQSHPDAPPTLAFEIETPPYKEPLLETADPKAWWAKHRPLFAQTAPIGPVDDRQRYGLFQMVDPPTNVSGREFFEGDVPADLFPAGTTFTPAGGPPPNPTFTGFRFIRVEDGAISVMRYVTLVELRENDFELPWEPGQGPVIDDSHPTNNGNVPVVNG